MFHFLLYVTKNVKQSHAVRGGWFRIEFQPGQGNLTHTHGDRYRFRPRYFFPFFLVRGSGIPSSATESDHSAPVRHDKNINPTSTKRVPSRSTRLSNQVFKLTDYHISRHVGSTFKRLTKLATHHDLIQFQLHQRGITTTQPRPLSLHFSLR
jgi:hypothetical protein